jgi:hypothetical protein
MEYELQDDSPTGSPRRPKRARTMLIVSAAAVGAAIGGAGIASAATSTSSTAASSTTAPAASASGSTAGQPADPATLKHGPGETLLTGTTAEKVKAAALAADPGATIIRVETDSAGSPYEAHIVKADGTTVTLKFDANFKLTATQSGFGAGPAGQAPPGAGTGAGAGAPSA